MYSSSSSSSPSPFLFGSLPSDSSSSPFSSFPPSPLSNRSPAQHTTVSQTPPSETFPFNLASTPFSRSTTSDAEVANAACAGEQNEDWTNSVLGPCHVNLQHPIFGENLLPFQFSCLDQYLKTLLMRDVIDRRLRITRALKIVLKSIRKVLSLVEQHEPRFKSLNFDFLSDLTKRNLDEVMCDQKNLEGGRIPGEFGHEYLSKNGVNILSSNEFEFFLYLSHSGTFTMNEFNDQSNCHDPVDRWMAQNVRPFSCCSTLNQQGFFGIPGTAALKLADGRKRSMSLWVEFITASGFLSARKLRLKFRQLVIQVLEKLTEKEKRMVRMEVRGENLSRDGGEEVVLLVRDVYRVTLTLSFRCENTWPRSATLRYYQSPWHGDMKSHGFDLVSKKILEPSGNLPPSFHPSFHAPNDAQPSTNEDDVWHMSFTRTQSLLLHQKLSPGQQNCLEIIKTLIEKHCSHLEERPIENSLLESLILYELEKHPRTEEWVEARLGQRLVGVLLQLTACLRNRSCLSYFVGAVDLLKGKATRNLDLASVETWTLLRKFIFMTSNNVSFTS